MSAKRMLRVSKTIKRVVIETVWLRINVKLCYFRGPANIYSGTALSRP